MPFYTYVCAECQAEVELLICIADRDKPLTHMDCGGVLARRKVEAFRIGAPSYVPGAVTSTGQLIPGHFGKTARRKGGRYKP